MPNLNALFWSFYFPEIQKSPEVAPDSYARVPAHSKAAGGASSPSQGGSCLNKPLVIEEAGKSEKGMSKVGLKVQLRYPGQALLASLPTHKQNVSGKRDQDEGSGNENVENIFRGGVTAAQHLTATYEHWDSCV